MSLATLIKSRIRRRWKYLVLVGFVWFWAAFPIPFVPLFGFQIGDSAMEALIMISILVTIPFTLLAIFMKDYERKD